MVGTCAAASSSNYGHTYFVLCIQMEQSERTPWLTHVRVVALMWTLLLVDAAATSAATALLLENGPSVLMLFGFEVFFALIMVTFCVCPTELSLAPRIAVQHIADLRRVYNAPLRANAGGAACRVQPGKRLRGGGGIGYFHSYSLSCRPLACSYWSW